MTSEEFCTGCGTGEQRCLAYGPGRKCCPDCEHIAALEEPTPGPQYTEDDPDWSAMVSPISDTDGGHDDR